MNLVPFASPSTDSEYHPTLLILLLISLLSLGVITALFLALRLVSFAASLFRRPFRPPGIDRATQTHNSPQALWLLYCDSLGATIPDKRRPT